MKRMGLAATALLATTTPASAMSVFDFLAKADFLKARGLRALGTTELGQVRDEMTTVATDYRADLAAARAAGRPPHSCPPPRGKGRIKPDELLGSFRSIPAAQQRTVSVKTAFYAMMRKRYPCPAA